MKRFLKRVLVVVLFVPALFGWALLGSWIGWLLTGEMPYPWPARLVDWANDHDVLETPF